MRHIKLHFDDNKFDKLKRVKETEEKMSEERISWEDFVFNKVMRK